MNYINYILIVLACLHVAILYEQHSQHMTNVENAILQNARKYPRMTEENRESQKAYRALDQQHLFGVNASILFAKDYVHRKTLWSATHCA